MGICDRDEYISLISDTYKEVHGFRPRFYLWSEMSLEQLQEEYNRLSDIVGEQIRAEREHEQAVMDALDDPDATVVVKPPFDDDREFIVSCIAHGDYSIFKVYRQEPAPVNTAVADALRAAIRGD